MHRYFILLLGLLRRVLRSRDDLLMENLVLRHRLAVYTRRPKRPVIVAIELADGPSSRTSTQAGGMRDLVSRVPAVRRGGALVGKAVVDSLGRQSVSAQGVVR